MGGARPVRSFLSGKMRLIADLWRPLLQMAVRWFASRKLVSISLRRSDHIAMKNCVVRQQTVRLTMALQRTTGNSTTIEDFYSTAGQAIKKTAQSWRVSGGLFAYAHE